MAYLEAFAVDMILAFSPEQAAHMKSNWSGNIVAEGVDYEYWSTMSGWNVEEAAALFLQIDPDQIPAKSTQAESAGWQYWRLYRLLARAEEMGELESPMSPRDFLTWAISNGVKVPEQLVVPVRAGKPHRNWRKRFLSMRRERNILQAKLDYLEGIGDEPNPNSKNTLLTMIGGLVRLKFQHEKGSPNTVGKVEKALDRLGCHLNNGTIRKCITEADRLFGDKFPDLK